jgi:hypothetical protein
MKHKKRPSLEHLWTIENNEIIEPEYSAPDANITLNNVVIDEGGAICVSLSHIQTVYKLGCGKKTVSIPRETHLILSSL